MKRMERKKITHVSAWIMSLLALPIVIILVCKGETPLQITAWLGVVVIVQLLHLLPEALTKKEVYNEED